MFSLFVEAFRAIAQLSGAAHLHKAFTRTKSQGRKLEKVSNCVLHYYGLLHCGGSDSSRRNVFPILPFHAWRRLAE